MKAQMEIMGLAVIVVLVTVGLFLFVSFTLNKPKPTIDTTYQYDQLSASFVDAFLRTNVPGCPLRLGELMRDCELNNQACGGYASCTLVEQVSERILNDTLLKRGVAYIFNVEYPMKPRLALSGNNCTLEKDTYPSTPFTVRLHPFPGDVVVWLDVCK